MGGCGGERGEGGGKKKGRRGIVEDEISLGD